MAVSVIINCFNGEKHLNKCIQSVIDQTYIDWEIIFWDNQSTDNSKNIINFFNDKRIKYYYASTHESLYSARNFAIEKASGKFIAFLDTDDFWLPLKLETQVKIFADDSVGVVCSNYHVLDELNNRNYVQYKKRSTNIKTNDLLKNYNVDTVKLINIAIDVKAESGTKFWASMILPFAMIWILSSPFPKNIVWWNAFSMELLPDN